MLKIKYRFYKTFLDLTITCKTVLKQIFFSISSLSFHLTYDHFCCTLLISKTISILISVATSALLAGSAERYRKLIAYYYWNYGNRTKNINDPYANI